ncbi:MAG TPA: nucleoside triphosphate pyrophosphohydrolase [Candidatus Acidoferrales bacterium]|nr:nucleoside triphosphate pyrophosphohydrolase [Candidatus Acidoferrales bacterium]
MIDAILEEAASRHAIHPSDGLQIVGAAALVRRAFDPSWPLLLLPDDSRPYDSGSLSAPLGAPHGTPPVAPDAPDGRAAFEPQVLPGRGAHGGSPLDVLAALYPGSHPVLGLAGAADATVGALEAADLARGVYLLPALDPLANLASPHGLPWIAARLRASGGCPWDREQDHASLRPFLLEEAYEVYDALEHGATDGLAEELGDLLLQIVLHAQLGAEEGLFDLDDVYRHIAAKIVRRHPHVFADAHAATAGDVIQNWERIKATERAARGGEPRASDTLPAAFAGLARSLPALAYAREMQDRAAALGYDWPDVEGVIEKLEEEAVELLEAEDDAHRTEEFGDLLLVLVNLGRKLGIDAESALRAGSAKFARRFAMVERFAAEHGRTLDAMTFEELDELWDRAKAVERSTAIGEDHP